MAPAAPVDVPQEPLLPEALTPGVTVAVARRSRHDLNSFFGQSDALNQDGEDAVVFAGLCALRISETVLVHYTKRPKALAKTVENTTEQETGAESGGTFEPPVDEKYWKRRYNYFARYDEGVRMDSAAWFEVTPESVARHIADRMPYGLVVDGTCGVGGNAIQFAMTSQRVIAVDTDASRLSDAAHNARVYGVHERIEFVHGDFAGFADSYEGPQIDAVFLSPPWGGPQHLDAEYFSLRDVEQPDIVRLFAAATRISPRVVLYLPRHVDLHEVAMLAAKHSFPAVDVEKVLFQYPAPHLKLCVIYFTPEAAVAPLQVGSAKKTVGPTGGPNPQTTMAAPVEMLTWPPLAGPVMRTLYCRYHYLGRYVVALAQAWERKRDATKAAADAPASGKRRRHLGRAERPDPNACGAGRHRGHQNLGEGAEADVREKLHSHIARALCEALGPDAGRNELSASLVWLLHEVPPVDLLRLASDAEAERLEASRSPSGAAVEWNSCFFALLRKRIPEVHHRLLEWRKAAAQGAESPVRNVAAAACTSAGPR